MEWTLNIKDGKLGKKGEKDMKQILNMPAAVSKAMAAVVIARAQWETIKEIDAETKADVLNKNTFVEEDTGKRILSEKTDFLMSESDFESYCKLVYAANCEKGFDSGSWDTNFWPIHKAVYDAEDALIRAITKDIPEYTPEVIKTVITSPKWRTEFLQIVGL